MKEDEDQDRRGFKVHDRRRFSDSGEPRESAETGPEPAPRAAEQQPTKPPQPKSAPLQAEPTAPQHQDSAAHSHPPGDHAGAESRHAMPPSEINFATFVISLSTQALASLGEIPDPLDGAIKIDLPGARQLIDILGMLQGKTSGNLDADEAALLQHALYDLRMKYVECAQRR